MAMKAQVWIAALFLCALVSVSPTQAQDEGVDSVAVVAKVGEQQITMSELLGAERRLRRFEQDQGDRELLQPFIDRELLLLEARKASLDTAAKVQRTLDGIRRRQLAEKVYREEVSYAVSVTDAEMRQYFVDNGLDQKREVRASHILVDKADLAALGVEFQGGEGGVEQERSPVIVERSLDHAASASLAAGPKGLSSR
ncbi:MAG TPA: hypothetical protein EYQ64_01995 [Gemmatimonadetes bacterium]|nr:hypothetical protein [Gemmatimonadota bacterium]